MKRPSPKKRKKKKHMGINKACGRLKREDDWPNFSLWINISAQKS